MKATPMPAAEDVVADLRPLGTEGYRRVLRNHEKRPSARC